MMKLVFKGILGLALVGVAVPAAAAERDCLNTAEGSIGARLTDQFFYEEGLGEQPVPYFDDLAVAMEACLAQYAVRDEDALVFTEMNVGYAMMSELRRRLAAAGTNVGSIDQGMIEHIPSVDTTFDDMFDHVGPDLAEEAFRLAESGAMDPKIVDSLLGAYSGAFHAAYVAQMKWDARQ